MCFSSGQAESFKKYTALGMASNALGNSTPTSAAINKVINKPIEKKQSALEAENAQQAIGQKREDLRLRLHQGKISQSQYDTSLLSLK